MQMLEPPSQQRQQHQHREQPPSLRYLHSTMAQMSTDFIVLLLSIIGITIAFAASIGFDYVIVLLLNWLFVPTLGVVSTAGAIFSLIQYISYLGAGISYLLMVFLLLGLYAINSLSLPRVTTKKNSKPLKQRVGQLLQDTGIVLINILLFFLIFVVLIVAIASALSLISLVIPPVAPLATLFLVAVKIFTAFAVLIAYIVYVIPPLWQYGKDNLTKLFEKPDEQEGSKT